MQIQTLKCQFRLWMILFVLVPSLVVMVIYTVGQIEVAKQESLKMINQRVHTQKALIDYWMTERSDDIRKVSQLEGARTLDEQRMRRILSVIQQNEKKIESLSYIDKEGRCTISTLPIEFQPPSAIEQPYFQAALEGKTYISDMRIGESCGLPIIDFSTPSFDDFGKFQGLILGSVRTTTLETLLRENRFADTGEVFLVNREGMLLTEPRDVDQLVDKGLIDSTAVMKLRLPEDALRTIVLGQSGTATWIGYNERKNLSVYLDIPERGWTVIGKMDEAEVLGSIRNQLVTMASATIFLMLLMIPLVKLVTNRIKRPLDWLLKQSEFIMAEHYKMVGCNKYPDKICYELSTLCETFVHMSHKIVNTISLLRENEAKLEYKVCERTNALSDMNIVLEEEVAKHQAANKALKESHDALTDSKNSYKNLFDYMHNGCSYHKVIFDDQGTPINLEFVSVNSAYEKQAGFLASDLVGKRLTEIFPQIKAESFNWMHLLTTVAISGEPASSIQYHEYLERWYSISAYSPVKNHVAVISEDITSYVTLQKEIARMDRLNLMGNMAAGLAHEIRNPMTVVKGYLQYFKKKIPANLHNQFDLVLSELVRIEIIISDFLSIAKNAPAELEKQDLNMIINSIAPLLQTDAIRRGMILELKLSEDIPHLVLAVKEMKQLLLNIAMNGFNAMEEHGVLTIETKVQGNMVLLYIADCGSGIPKELQSKIFDPFFTTRDEGTGLGLSVCARIVADHGGTIELDSEEGRGTRFIIKLPVSEEQ